MLLQSDSYGHQRQSLRFHDYRSLHSCLFAGSPIATINCPPEFGNSWTWVRGSGFRGPEPHA
jgi:hypothetical protein